MNMFTDNPSDSHKSSSKDINFDSIEKMCGCLSNEENLLQPPIQVKNELMNKFHLHHKKKNFQNSFIAISSLSISSILSKVAVIAVIMSSWISGPQHVNKEDETPVVADTSINKTWNKEIIESVVYSDTGKFL